MPKPEFEQDYQRVRRALDGDTETLTALIVDAWNVAKNIFRASGAKMEAHVSTADGEEVFYPSLMTGKRVRRNGTVMVYREISMDLAHDLAGQFILELLDGGIVKLLSEYNGEHKLWSYVGGRLRGCLDKYLEQLSLRTREPRLSKSQAEAMRLRQEEDLQTCLAYRPYFHLLKKRERYVLERFYCGREPLIGIANKLQVDVENIRRVRLRAERRIIDIMRRDGSEYLD